MLLPLHCQKGLRVPASYGRVCLCACDRMVAWSCVRVCHRQHAARPLLPARSIIYHAGPTNSGKTYNALQAMRAAESGVYCGPLRQGARAALCECVYWPGPALV